MCVFIKKESALNSTNVVDMAYSLSSLLSNKVLLTPEHGEEIASKHDECITTFSLKF